MLAKNIMTSRVVTITPDTPVVEIARLLMQWSISAVPVVEDDDRIVGIVSEGDLIRREELGTAGKARSWWLDLVSQPAALADDFAKSHGKCAADVMTRNIISVSENTELPEIAELMEKHRIKRVPVLRDGKLVGIVSRANFIQRIAASKEVRVVPVNADDDAIKVNVESALAREPWASVGTTNITVSAGIVEFWGTVASDSELKASRVAAENVAGVAGVNDHRAVQSVVPGGGL